MRRLLFAVVAGLLLSLTATTAAQAASGFRFWGYYQWTGGKWAFATKGAAQTVPADGSVEGWRFAVAPETISRLPRADGDFAKICAAAPAEQGKKRVALIIDGGLPADAPAGSTPIAPKGVCVVTAPSSSGAQILAAAATVRVQKGLTCGIDGYPAAGCGEAVRNANIPARDAQVQLSIAAPIGSSAATTSPVPSTGDETPVAGDGTGADTNDADSNDSAPWATIAVVAVIVLLLGGAGIVAARRRRTS